MKFLKGFSISAFANIILIGVAFLNNIIITRQIGPEGRGIYTVISNLIILLTLFLGEGLRRSNTILVGKNKTVISELITNTTVYTSVVFLILILIYFIKDLWIYLLPNIGNSLLILSLLIIIFSLLWQSLQAILLGLNKYFEFNLIQLISAVVSLLINVVGIYIFNFQVFEIIFSLLISSITSFLYGVFIFQKQVRIPNLKIFKFQSIYNKLSFKSTISAGFIFIILRSNIFIINIFLGPVEAGLYSIAYIFLDMTQKLPNIASPLLFAKSVSNVKSLAVMNTVKLVRVIFSLNILIVLFLILFGKYIILLLFTSDFLDSYYILLFLMPAILFFGCGAIIYSFYMSEEYPKIILFINAFSAIASLILNVLLIKIYGTIGAPIAISISFVLWTASMTIYFMKDNKLNVFDLFLIKKEDLIYVSSNYKKRK